jgi:hypothetical protein
MSFHISEASVLKDLDHDSIDSRLRKRREWRAITNQQPRPLSPQLDISPAAQSDLHAVCTVLQSSTCPFKMVVSHNTVWIYTNHTALLDTINALSEINFKKFFKAVIARPKNTILLKASKYASRCYFKSLKLTSEEKKLICNFFNNNQDNIRIGPAFKTWCDSRFTRLQDYFFIDYTNESWLVMLSLIRPGLIRKTMQIVIDK